MKNRFLILNCVCFLSFFACGQSTQPVSTTMPVTKPVENISPTPDQQERRERSEKICTAHQVPVYKNPNSLFVDAEENVSLRTQDEVVDRAIALCYLELKSEGLEKNLLADFDKKYNVMTKLTPNEKIFALADQPTQQQITDANWRAESYHVLLWALGFVEKMNYPDQLCNIGEDVRHLFSRTEQQFREQAQLRSKAALLDEADLILRLHWACVSTRIQNQPAPGNLDKSVVYERHYALNWLICYQHQDWDHVTTDT